MPTKESSPSSTTGAFMTGLMIGAAATALLVPRSGREIRTAVKRRASQMRTSMNQGADAVQDAVQEGMDASKKTLRTHSIRGRNTNETNSNPMVES